MDRKKSTLATTSTVTFPSKITLLDLTERERSQVLKANRGLLARTQRRLAVTGVTLTLSGVAKTFARGKRPSAVIAALEEELNLMIRERQRAKEEREERRRKGRETIALLTKSA